MTRWGCTPSLWTAVSLRHYLPCPLHLTTLAAALHQEQTVPVLSSKPKWPLAPFPAVIYKAVGRGAAVEIACHSLGEGQWERDGSILPLQGRDSWVSAWTLVGKSSCCLRLAQAAVSGGRERVVAAGSKVCPMQCFNVKANVSCPCRNQQAGVSSLNFAHQSGLRFIHQHVVHSPPDAILKFLTSLFLTFSYHLKNVTISV